MRWWDAADAGAGWQAAHLLREGSWRQPWGREAAKAVAARSGSMLLGQQAICGGF